MPKYRSAIKFQTSPGSCATLARSRARGADAARSGPVIFITHHVISRMAQRLELRTADDLYEAVRVIWNAATVLMKEKGADRWLAAPPQGWRVPLDADGACVVLQRHFKRRASDC